MKKILRTIVFFLISAILVTWIMFGPLIKGAMSVKKLDEGIYYLEFSGNDGFDRFLKQGGASDAYRLSAYITGFLSRGFSKQPAAEPQKQDFGCSTMAAVTADGTRLMGRNFDWQDCRCIITKVNPKGGYRYISAFNPDFFGFGPDWEPEGFANQYIALATLFAALDGVNEKGLAVADLTAGINAETHQDNGKPDLTTTCAIKYLLKSAASVDEAISLLDGIDYHSDIGNLHHLSISDASGRSVVVEWVGEKMVVTDTPIVTNHYLCPENFGFGLYEGDCRFEKLQAVRDSLGATMSKTQLLDAMSVVWQSWSQEQVTNGGTQWTVLFDLSNPSVDYIWRRDTTKRFHFDLCIQNSTRNKSDKAEKVVASYVTSWTEVMPDPFLLTHVNYAFGHVKDSFDGLEIDNVDRLKAIVRLKEQNPKLKVVLSVGGWGSGNFSEMAAERSFRKSFCADCAKAVKELDLDGIDIDWEYPGNGEGAGISWSPDDKENFTLLMKDLRSALGKKKLLTLASCCDPKYIDFPSIMDVVDLVNTMTYDMNEGGDTFHCALYPSEHTADWTTDTSVKAHIEAGVPADKLVMGVPFYGKGVRSYRGGRDFGKMYPIPDGYTITWDEKANAPYIVDEEGNFAFGFENERSLKDKVEYIKNNGLRGVMNWDYDGDDDNLTLTRIMHSVTEK